MKLGMPLLFEYEDAEDNIRLAKSLDLDFIELNYNFSYCRKQLNEGKVQQLLDDNDLEASIHFFDEADFGAIDDIRINYIDIFRDMLKSIAATDRIKNVVIHLNPGPVVTISGKKHYVYEKEHDEFKERLYDSLDKLKDLCERHNKTLVLENTAIPSFLETVYIELAKKGYRFCFDIGHDYLNGNRLKELQKGHDFIFREFHIHNSDGFKDHLALHKGIININYYKTMALVHDSYVVIEVKESSDLRQSVPLFKDI